MLLKSGADPNATNVDGSTPLHLAVLNKHLKVLPFAPIIPFPFIIYIFVLR